MILIKKLFFGCSLLDYERIHFNDYISIHAYNNDNSFQDSFAFCEFTLNGTLDKKYFDTYFQLLEEFNQCFEKGIYKTINIEVILKLKILTHQQILTI